MAKFLRILFLFLFFWGQYNRAQNIAYFDQFSIKSGLSQSTVSAMIQDDYGFMWIGTQDGLNRYSNKENKIFSHQPFGDSSLLGSQVFDLFKDERGNIWVFNTGGLDYINSANFKISHAFQFKVNKEFEKIYKAWMRKNVLYLSTEKGIFYVKNPYQNKLSYEKLKANVSLDKNIIVHSVTTDSEGSTIIATNAGFFRIPINSSEIYNIKGLENYRTTLAADVAGDKLVFTQNDVLYVSSLKSDNKKAEEVFKAGAVIYDVKIDLKGNIWLTTSGDGVYVISNENSETNIKYHFKSENNKEYFKCNYTSKIVIDKLFNKSNVWIGTRDDGVYCYSSNKNIFNFLSFEVQLPESNFFGITKDKDENVWVAANENIYYINCKDKTWKKIYVKDICEKATRPIECILCDEENNLWFGLGDDLYKINTKKNGYEKIISTISNINWNQVYRILNLDKNRLLIASNGGLTIYNKLTGVKENISKFSYNNTTYDVNKVNEIFIDKNKNWWYRTGKGLMFYNPESGEVKNFTHDTKDTNSILSNVILDIDQLNTGEIIAGTPYGISILTDYKKGIFSNYTKSNYFKSSFVYCVIPDKDNNVWMATNYGIYVFNSKTKQFICYDSESGGFINEYNSGGYFKSANGDLLFAGIGGVVDVKPQQIKSNIDTLPIFTTLFYNNNTSFINTFTSTKQIELDYNNSGIEFKFEIPSYFNGNISILYKIKEKDSLWKQLDANQTLRQLNLAPGNYTFEISAEDNSGRIAFRKNVFEAKINPPFWITPWFYVMIVLLVSLISFVFYKYKMKQKMFLMKEIEKIRFDENEKVRKAAAMDLHDEFGNGLARISMLIEVIKDNLPENNNAEIKKNLTLVSENSSRLYQGTKDFIWSINPLNETMFEVVIRIKDYADELFSGSKVVFELKGIDENLKQIKNVPAFNRNITMIFKEALANILKHAEATKVEMFFENTSEFIIIKLKDNGRGYDTASNKKGYGLGNMIARAKKIDAELNIVSEVNKGTQLILKIKK